MKIIYYPDKKKINEAIKVDNPLLILVAHDGSKTLVSDIDDSFEHIILLRKLGIKETDIDLYFRVIVNKSGADWTFVCPSDYKAIKSSRGKHLAEPSTAKSLPRSILLREELDALSSPHEQARATGYSRAVIKDRAKRIEKYYNDGIGIIDKGLNKLGYDVPITIPQRFRRHFHVLGNGK